MKTVVKRDPEMRCSTPFGITEGGILVGKIEQWPAILVLNAFRHHRGGHRAVDVVATARARAQRLSASQRGA